MRDLSKMPGDMAHNVKQLTELFDRELPVLIGNENVNFFKDSFQRQGWRDKGFEPWRQRKHSGRRSGGRRAILVSRGHLRDSIRVTYARGGRIVTAAGNNAVPYAQIHNEGGTTHPRVTEKMRKYAWAQYKNTGNGFWKGLATTKKQRLTVQIPKRQFIGHSHVLDERNEKIMKRVFDRVF